MIAFCSSTTDLKAQRLLFISPTPSIAATTMNFCLASTIFLTILWTFAIMLLPDESSSAASAQRVDGLVVNGNHYVLDTNVEQTRSGNGSYRVIRAVNVKTPRNTKKRVSTRYHVCISVVPCFAVSYPRQPWLSESKSCSYERSLECIN